MKALKTAAKTVLFILVCSWLAAFSAMCLCWTLRFNGADLNAYIRVLRYAFVISLCAFTAATAIYRLVQRLKKSQSDRLLEKTGYSEEYFAKLTELADKTKRAKKAFELRLLLAREYADGEQFDKAEQALSKAEGLGLNRHQRLRLCAAYLEIYSLMKNKTAAGEYFVAICEAAGPYIDKKGIGGEICFSAALYYYLCGEYDKALSQSIKAVKLSEGKKETTDSKLFYALCLLKNGEYATAKRAVETASGGVSTPAQVSRLKSLMTAVERAYGITS